MIHGYFNKFLLIIVLAIFSGLPALAADIDHVAISEISIEANFEEYNQEKKIVFENDQIDCVFCGGFPSQLSNRLTVLYQVLPFSLLNHPNDRFYAHSSRAPPFLNKI